MADLAVTLSSPQGTSRPPLALPLKDVVELARKIDRLLAKVCLIAISSRLRTDRHLLDSIGFS